MDISILGLDPGGKYLAWSLIKGNMKSGFRVEKHGLIMTNELGSTHEFGYQLYNWTCFFDVCLAMEFKPDLIGAERFTYSPGKGKSSEAVNLQIGAMAQPNVRLWRNTEWKRWFKKEISPEGTEGYFGYPTPHECDAAGIGLYTAYRHYKK